MQESLQSQPKTDALMQLLKQIIEQENKYIHFDSVVEFSDSQAGVPEGKTSIKQGANASLLDPKD